MDALRFNIATVFAATALRAILYLFPAISPLLTPAKRPQTGQTSFRWQICLGNTLGHITARYTLQLFGSYSVLCQGNHLNLYTIWNKYESRAR